MSNGILLDPEVVVLLHLASHVLHLFQAGRDQAGQTNDVGAFELGACASISWQGTITPHVDHVKVVALQHHGHDVLADVVDVALDGGNHDLALGLGLAAGFHHGQLFGLDIRQQDAPRHSS